MKNATRLSWAAFQNCELRLRHRHRRYHIIVSDAMFRILKTGYHFEQFQQGEAPRLRTADSLASQPRALPSRERGLPADFVTQFATDGTPASVAGFSDYQRLLSRRDKVMQQRMLVTPGTTHTHTHTRGARSSGRDYEHASGSRRSRARSLSPSRRFSRGVASGASGANENSHETVRSRSRSRLYQRPRGANPRAGGCSKSKKSTAKKFDMWRAT